jgi:hypothetical protein
MGFRIPSLNIYLCFLVKTVYGLSNLVFIHGILYRDINRNLDHVRMRIKFEVRSG